MTSRTQTSPADSIPNAEVIIARLAVLARERQVLRGLLRLVRHRDRTPPTRPGSLSFGSQPGGPK
ncbi:MAG: hypothetical protein U0840_31195 [Gemmataceae bacterium]